jgi:hypothetical protein
MADNGVKSTDLTNASLLDEVIGNRSGSTVAATMFTLAQQLLGSGPLADAIALDGQAHWRSTLASLNTVTGQTGDNGFVVNDGANNGVYRWSGSAWAKVSVLPGALGFRNLDDTSDANKPVSTATKIALARASTGVTETSKNVLNPAAVTLTEGKFIDPASGNLNNNSGYAAITGIFGQFSGPYYFRPKNYISWRDAAGNHLGGSAVTDTNPVQNAPAGAVEIRMSIRPGDGDTLANSYVAEGTSPLAGGVTFGSKLIAPTQNLPKQWINPDNTTFLALGDNLFDVNAVLLGGLQSTGNVATGSTTYDLSQDIPIIEGQAISYGVEGGPGARFRTVKDANGTVIDAQSSTVETRSYTPPLGSGAASVCFTVFKDSKAKFMCNVGTTLRNWVPYGYVFDDRILVGVERSTWAGKVGVSYGDSVTAQLMWQPQAAAKLGFSHTALGVGGRQAAGEAGGCQQVNIDTIPTNTELLLVMFGVNDWAQSRLLGSANSSNTDEFNGALNVMCQRLMTRLPTARICLMTPTYGLLTDWQSRGNWQSGVINGVGLSIPDYAVAVRDAARRWGLPMIDVSADEGVNVVNVNLYRKDDGGRLHPNIAGGDRIAEVLIGCLNRLAPLS